MSPTKPTLWIYLAIAIALVLLGGAFAGLTIALMGQVYTLCIRSELERANDRARMRFIFKSSKSPESEKKRVMLREC